MTPPGSTILDPVVHYTTGNGAEQAEAVNTLLATFKVPGRVELTEVGPAVIRHKISLDAGVRVNRLTVLTRELQGALRAETLRIQAPIPGTNLIGLEIPNPEPTPVALRELVESPEYLRAGGALTVALGRDMAGRPLLTDLTSLPHLLIAGATGSGKSVALNSLIAGLMLAYSPAQLRLCLVDPKRVELAIFADSPHLYTDTITDMALFGMMLEWLLKETDRRYTIMARNGVRNIAEFNAKFPGDQMPRFVLVVDEFAEALVTRKRETELAICRLAQVSRAAGVTLILATQRPTISVITGNIKANVPGRLAFAMSSYTDSLTVLNERGAEALLGRGDMLFHGNGAPDPLRAQGVFVSDGEIQRIISYWRGEAAFSAAKIPVHNFQDNRASYYSAL